MTGSDDQENSARASKERRCCYLENHNENGLPPPPQTCGLGVFATYRTAYLENKLLLLEAMTEKKKLKGKNGDLRH